jgi:hypothetical protein
MQCVAEYQNHVKKHQFYFLCFFLATFQIWALQNKGLCLSTTIAGAGGNMERFRDFLMVLFEYQRNWEKSLLRHF